LIPISEVTLRLTYGHIHLEFIMLSGEKVAIRDSSRNKPSCSGLHRFFELISNDASKSYKGNEYQLVHSGSPIQPASVSSEIVSASPAGTPLSACLSVPLNPDAVTVSPATEVSAELETSSTPIIIDHETLRRAFVFVKSPYSNLLCAPIDDYLSGLCFIRKLTLAFEAQMRNQSAGRLVLNEMKCGLHFATKNSPPASDIATLERYFEQVVCRLNNELAVFSFINLCRIVANGAISGIVQVMNAQMVGFSCETDPSPSLYWNVSIQLVCLAREQANANTRRFQTGTVFDANNINVLILVSAHVRGKNSIKQHGTEDESMVSILMACSQEAARTGECPLWPAIRQCLDKVSSANVAGMPASVGYMPGSVGGPVSVGPIGSVGTGHNPGSIVNPGSNT
uniref:Pan3_PK domain-containing protein n=1 Tax=Angiostrongylus cantonensis TaxID=6313 RepID=A0A0K0CX28_ANGCA